MPTAVDRGAFVEEVMWRGAIRDRARAEAVIGAVLAAVAGHLGPDDRAFIAERLPVPDAEAMRAPAAPAASSPADLHARLATIEKVSVGLAVEHARAACAGLAELVGEDGRALLIRRLPPDWAALFTPPVLADRADIPAGTVPGRGHTLATGRPGSSRPLSEAKPRAGRK